MNTTPVHVQKFLDRLEGVRRSGMGWAAHCPCRNDDQNQSLTIGVGKTDQVLVKCHRGGGGCTVEEICKYAGLGMKDLYPEGQEPPAAKKDRTKMKRKIESVYPYVDEEWNVIYEKVKYRYEDGSKGFSQRRLDPAKPGEYIYSLDSSVRRVLYNLPMVLAAVESGDPIWLVEGEKDAATLEANNVIATTMPNGAGTWEQSFTDILAKASAVMIVADNDEPGKRHALNIQSLLHGAGCKRVDVWMSPFGKDITDHIDAGHSIDDLTALEYELPEQISETTIVESNPEQKLLEEIVSLFSKDGLKTDQKITRVKALLDVHGIVDLGDQGRLVNWQDFLLEAEQDKYEWVIPGLLEKQERVIVVAAEGVGKTMLARQVAILSAAGLHPFTFQAIPPVRTLTIDLENPERIIRRTSRYIMQQAIRFAKDKHGAMKTQSIVDAHLLIKPAGIDLMSAKGRALFEQTVDEVRPQLLCIGPLYKSYHDSGTLTSESLAVEVAKFLDHIRDAYDCALWIEHHAPLGQSQTSRELRPFGSAVWSRWPEFGIALQPDPTAGAQYIYEVRHFRGARDRRPWPLRMKRGVQFPFETLEFMQAEIEGQTQPSGNPGF